MFRVVGGDEAVKEASPVRSRACKQPVHGGGEPEGAQIIAHGLDGAGIGTVDTDAAGALPGCRAGADVGGTIGRLEPAGAIPIRRNTKDPAYLITLKAYVAEMLKKHDLFLYPEGGRSYSGELKQAKTGLLHAALTWTPAASATPDR